MALRIAIAAVLAVHGVMHAFVFAVPFRLALVQGMPDPAVALFGRVHFGESGARAFGIVWFLVGVAFLAAAAGVVAGAHWAVTLTLVAAVASTALCIAGAPASLTGVVVDVVVLLLFGYAWLAGSALRALH